MLGRREGYTSTVMVAERIRRALRGGILSYLAPAALFLALGVPLVLLIRGEQRNNRLLSQYQAQQAIVAAGEAMRRGSDPQEAVGQEVLGFGSYDAGGEAILRWGSAPDRIRPGEAAGPGHGFTFDRRKRSLVLVWMLRIEPRPRLRPRGEPPPLPPPENPAAPPGQVVAAGAGQPPAGVAGQALEAQAARAGRFPRTFFVEISTARYWRRQDILTATMVVLIGLLAAALTVIQVSYRRSAEYRRRLQDQEQLVRLGEAARTLSHEIKNPLSAIRLRTDILQRFTSPQGAEDLATIQREVDRLRLLTERIGDFLRDSRGNEQVLDLSAFLQKLCARMSAEVRFEDRAQRPCPIAFDPDRLHSVIENLVQNARESESPPEEVVLRLETARHRAIVSVLDRGCGVPAEILDRLFDPFFTTKTRGSGIGLSMARRFVEAAGGTLTLSRREGGGAEARIVLRQARP